MLAFSRVALFPACVLSARGMNVACFAWKTYPKFLAYTRTHIQGYILRLAMKCKVEDLDRSATNTIGRKKEHARIRSELSPQHITLGRARVQSLA